MNQDVIRLEQVIRCLSPKIKIPIEKNKLLLAPKLREIRLRINRPVCLDCGDQCYYLTTGGSLTPFISDSLLCASKDEIEETVQSVCDYSVYSHQHELLNGYVTLRGGHRAGVCGTAVYHGDSLDNIRDIGSVCLRLSREFPGCADTLFRRYNGGGLLLCGEPCSGKTTLLRDLARQLSYQYRVALIDERGELAAVLNGEPQNDVGLCDIFTGYYKSSAMRHALRSMSPEIVVCDEIGSPDDAAAFAECQRSGVNVIATAHAGSAEELLRRRDLRWILRTGAIKTLVFLSDRQHVGQIRAVRKAGELLAS